MLSLSLVVVIVNCAGVGVVQCDVVVATKENTISGSGWQHTCDIYTASKKGRSWKPVTHTRGISVEIARNSISNVLSGKKWKCDISQAKSHQCLYLKRQKHCVCIFKKLKRLARVYLKIQKLSCVYLKSKIYAWLIILFPTYFLNKNGSVISAKPNHIGVYI